MEFRWVAIITLWTMLAGPVFFRIAMPPAPQASGVELSAASQTPPPLTQTPEPSSLQTRK